MPSTPYQTSAPVPVGNRGMYPLQFTFALADIAAGNLVTTYTMTHKFKVVDIRAVVTKAATTASKAATITAQITPAGGSASAVSGASLGMTSANMTPIGKVNLATATDIMSGGNNQGNAGDSITIAASSVTAFVEGTATIMLTIQDIEDQ